MNRRMFFTALAGAAVAGAGIAATTGEADAASFAPLPSTAPGLDLQKAWHYPWHRPRRRCRRVWNGYRWVTVC